MDMDAAYGNEKNPLIEKSEFILSVFEQLVGAGNLSAKEKSILDRCAADVYRIYPKWLYRRSSDIERYVPTVDVTAGRRGKGTCTVIRTFYQWKPEHLCTADQCE